MTRAPSRGLDVTTARIALRERTMLDLLDLSLRFIVLHLRVYAVTSLVVLPPFMVATFLIGRYWGWWIAWILALFASNAVHSPFTALAGRLVFEERVRARDAIMQAVTAFPRTFLTRIIQIVGIAGGLLLFVPGVWLAVRFFFVGEVIILERAKAFASFSRAQRIIGGFSGEALLAMLTLFVLHFVAVALVDASGLFVFEEMLQIPAPASMWTAGGSIFAVIGFWLAVPYLATAKLFVYLNVRTSSEGWDVQTRFLALQQRARESTSEERAAA